MSDNIVLKPSERLDLLTKRQAKKPTMYNVVFKNDDYTPAKHVVELLMDHFNKSRLEAWAVAMEVHHSGRGVAGTYTFEVAEEKVAIVDILSKVRQHPFKAEREPA